MLVYKHAEAAKLQPEVAEPKLQEKEEEEVKSSEKVKSKKNEVMEQAIDTFLPSQTDLLKSNEELNRFLMETGLM